MDVRDAVEGDDAALAAVAGAPRAAVRTLIHDRTVRVAVPETAAEAADAAPVAEGSEAARDDGGGSVAGGDVGDEVSEGAGEGEDLGDEEGENAGGDEAAHPVLGFVSYDADPGVVHVTQLAGTRAARERLVEEPVRFARCEGMAVEVLVPEAEADTRGVVEAAGFEADGAGPSFEGEATVRYRLEP